MKRHGFSAVMVRCKYLAAKSLAAKSLAARSLAVRLVGPWLAAPEREIVGVGGLPVNRFLWLDHLVRDALPFTIGNGLFLAVETQAELLFHVARGSPAHQGLDVARLLRFVIEPPFPGRCPARLHRVFGGLKNACDHGWSDPVGYATLEALGRRGR